MVEFALVLFGAAAGAVVAIAVLYRLDPLSVRVAELHKVLNDAMEGKLWSGEIFSRQYRTLPPATRGLYNRYLIAHTDGTPVDPDAVYFVLRLDNSAGHVHRLSCRAAVRTYAARAKVAPHLVQLCADLVVLCDNLDKEDAENELKRKAPTYERTHPGAAGTGVANPPVPEQPDDGR